MRCPPTSAPSAQCKRFFTLSTTSSVLPELLRPWNSSSFLLRLFCRDRPTWDMRFMTWDPEDEAPEEIYNLAKLCPPAEPLPDTVMADIRRQLTADPYHTPHILLDSHKDDTKKSSNDIEIAAPAKEPYRSIVVPQGHPAADSVMRFARCPYLKAAEEAAGTNASPTKATA